jgi:hypothetical protein
MTSCDFSKLTWDIIFLANGIMYCACAVMVAWFLSTIKSRPDLKANYKT